MVKTRGVSVDEVLEDLLGKYALPKRKSKAYDSVIVSTGQLKNISDSTFKAYGEDIELNELIGLLKNLDSFEKKELVNLSGLPSEIYRMFLKEKTYDIGFQALLSINLTNTEWRSLWKALRSCHMKRERDFEQWKDKWRFVMFASSAACPIEILNEYSERLVNITQLREDPYDEKHYFYHIIEAKKGVKTNLGKNRTDTKLFREKPKDFKGTTTVNSVATEKLEQSLSSVKALPDDIGGLSSKDFFEEELKCRLNSNATAPRIAAGSWKKKHIGLPQFEFLSNASKLEIAFPDKDRHYDLVEDLLETGMLDDQRLENLLNFDDSTVYRDWCFHELFPNSKLHDLLSFPWGHDYYEETVTLNMALKPNVPPEILDRISKDFICSKLPELSDLPKVKFEAALRRLGKSRCRTRKWKKREHDALKLLKKKIRALIAATELSTNLTVEALIKEFEIDRSSAVEVVATFQAHKGLFKKHDFSTGNFSNSELRYTNLGKIASKSSTSECLLGLLTQAPTDFCHWQSSEITSVMSQVLRNPNVTTSVVGLLADRIIELERARITLVKDHDSLDVLRRRKRKASQAELDAYENHDFMYYTGKDANKAVLSRDPFGVLLALCSNLKIDSKRLKTMSKSKDYLIRFAAAGNPGTPNDVLGEMQSDPHIFVARRATEALAASKQKTGKP